MHCVTVGHPDVCFSFPVSTGVRGRIHNIKHLTLLSVSSSNGTHGFHKRVWQPMLGGIAIASGLQELTLMNFKLNYLKFNFHVFGLICLMC
jgi:hypothetical protein